MKIWQQIVGFMLQQVKHVQQKWLDPNFTPTDPQSDL